MSDRMAILEILEENKKKADERKFVMHKNISHNQGYTIDEMKK
jgi:hypothetical protein